jgi:hypothetical protein
MAERSTTERYEVCAAVKEAGDGTPWIMFEPRDESLSILGNGFLGLDLQEGVTFEEAQELSEKLREMVRSVSYTRSHDGR